MPELPEVETLRRALLPLVRNRALMEMQFFRPDIRFPIPAETLKRELIPNPIADITRRGKYLLLHASSGAMVWHLGMSGRISQKPSMQPVEKHTHAAFRFAPATCLHFIDPRRFGSIVWAPNGVGHPLLNHLGLDPLDPQTTAKTLMTLAKSSKAPVKSFLMDSKRLTGVGNIYASEALFGAGIHPLRPVGRLTLPAWEKLLEALRETLQESIASGGTTLRNFFSADGAPGYYAIRLSVYGKESQPCPRCGAPVARIRQTGRSSFFCKICQKW